MTTITNHDELASVDGGGKVECIGVSFIWGADIVCIGISF